MDRRPRLSLIVAMSQNHCIGMNNDIPWHIPEDLKYFKNITLGKTVIMGRKTYDSIGKPLPHRKNIVVTRNPLWEEAGVEVAPSLEESLIKGEGSSEVIVIGGSQIYKEALEYQHLSRMYITRVHSHIGGDTFFPEYDQTQWVLKDCDNCKSDINNPYDYSFEIWDKISA